MESIETFVLSNKTAFCKVLTKINGDDIDTLGYPRKKITGFPKGYTNFTFEDSCNYKSYINDPNQIIYKVPNNYLVIDTDEEKTYIEFKKILKYFHIYEKKCITNSFRGNKFKLE
jgi:hypothetical protein